MRSWHPFDSVNPDLDRIRLNVASRFLSAQMIPSLPIAIMQR
jgi:hypothetical protein